MPATWDDPHSAGSPWATGRPYTVGHPSATGAPADGWTTQDWKDAYGAAADDWTADDWAAHIAEDRPAAHPAAGGPSHQRAGTRPARFIATTRGSQLAGGSFTASRMPISRSAAAGMPAQVRRDAAPERLSGAHRAPVRRGNGRVRLAAAGTVSLAGLSAIVAGVTFGGDPGGPATVPTAGDSRIQYTGGPDAFSSSLPAAAHGRTQSTTAPRAESAPSADQAGSGSAAGGGSGQQPLRTTSLGGGTPPVPVITLVPSDEAAATGPTDLRALAAVPAASAATKSADPSATITPAASTPASSSLPFDPDSPDTTVPTPSGSASAQPEDGSLPFDPAPILITPLQPTQPAQAGQPTPSSAATHTAPQTTATAAPSSWQSSAATSTWSQPPVSPTKTATAGATTTAQPASTTGTFWSVH